MAETKNGKSIYIAMVIVLLALNAWLFFNAQQNKKATIQFRDQYREVDSLNKALEVRYDKLMQEFNTEKGEAATKDSLISHLQEDLQLKRNRINSLLQSGGNNTPPASSGQLQEAKEQIAQLESDLELYKLKFEEINMQYQVLQSDYNKLQSAYDILAASNKQLYDERDSIFLIGSTIMTAGIHVIPLQVKQSGDKETEKAKKTNKLQIDFEVVPNLLSAGRKQIFYIKLTDPNAILMKASEEMGGEFSAMVSVDYEGNAPERHTVYWEQNYTFLPGTYGVEMFHNGFNVGSNTFELR